MAATHGPTQHGPLNAPPVSLYWPYNVRTSLGVPGTLLVAAYLTALLEPLAGLELGTYDREVLAMLTATSNRNTVATLASLLHRARLAEPIPVVDQEKT